MLEQGARRLGAAFQKINFLRDLGTDWLGARPQLLSRGSTPAPSPRTRSASCSTTSTRTWMSPHRRSRTSRANCRRAVTAAHSVFRALAAELWRTPAGELGPPPGAGVEPAQGRDHRCGVSRPRPGARMTARQRAVVIGGGIAGLASAALLAREGFAVTLLEARDELGGRAGSWERDGFRFDTGPSWYLMPEVFDHFYRLLGTTSDEQLDLIRLDPAYRVYLRVAPGSARPPARMSAPTWPRSSGSSRGAGAALERYLDSARETYRHGSRQLPVLDLPADLRPFRDRAVVARAGRLVRLMFEPLDRYIRDGSSPTCGCGRCSAIRRCSSGILAVHRAEPVPPDEPPRSRGRRAVPARRVARGDQSIERLAGPRESRS